MIPLFPDFKKLELADEKDVEKITSKFPPYSDFNFISMWSWNLVDKMQISRMHDNLVVRFVDYLTGEAFFSFIGENKILETALELIDFSQKNHQISSLKLIPEEIANFLAKEGFIITPDINSHDYIYSISHLADMNTWPRNSSSKGIRQFIKKHPDYIIKQNSIKEISEEEYIGMFKRWAKNKNIKDHSELNEYKAFRRLFKIDNESIKVVSLYLKDVLVGFTVYEVSSHDYAVSHFAKVDVSHHSSAYDVLNWEEAKILKKQKIKYYNWEQDLGIQGLRNSKLKYKPSFLLKKFVVTNSPK